VTARAAAGLALGGAGLAVVADGLVTAGRAAGGSGLARAADGLWAFRLEHALLFTVGALLAASALPPGRWRNVLEGVLAGMIALAAATLAAATWEWAAHGGGAATWLRQAGTAAGFAAAWAAVFRIRPRPATAAPADLPPVRRHAEPATARARRAYRERLAYSPRSAEARGLVAEIAAREAGGDTAAAERLLADLERL
jgi:hypothetical protein